ncbi:ABC transporter ATP-binding protein [Pediococcus damnosus]|uniref:ABC transporter ATP-binding protein n=1 Tax=Pediococcus damnosus TaxID=51663 RepID=A0A0R2HUF2_9LACO|nr:ATP-binding cassette domain-containing protein [Pediococcus damnosus]AMV63323.1 ABC transporter ATP-binding protein [Pediococcus damnosus]AMV66776.1 ABC transporter ATP-binding protein [Pediococcus damnosus]KJU73511.1 ABC transporter ATP-binding protein [Pediococcus damnosus LMG 28219]KRN53450.1 ABC-type uncharacterized transport system, ATPase component [Pediococcus damnosus]PIO81563.1 ABC transporter ATP-binding protein [Pediococcus damnosus]
MTNPILELQNVTTYVNRHTPDEQKILRGINLKVYPGDFITILGSNGAGKSTLFNTIGGNLAVDDGHILVNDKDVTHLSEEKRTRFLSRVFQDPKLGTAPRMTVSENLLLAEKRGARRGLVFRGLKRQMPHFQEITSTMENDLSKRLNTPAGELSGGQRQALSFLMATIKRPDILLLDEHTAALDPKTSRELLKATDDRIREDKLTCLMITHHLEDALKYGNRLIVLDKGQIKIDVTGAEKQKLTMDDLYKYFEI